MLLYNKPRRPFFPAVLLTQILDGLAYPVNGILMGGLKWWYSMLTT